MEILFLLQLHLFVSRYLWATVLLQYFFNEVSKNNPSPEHLQSPSLHDNPYYRGQSCHLRPHTRIHTRKYTHTYSYTQTLQSFLHQPIPKVRRFTDLLPLKNIVEVVDILSASSCDRRGRREDTSTWGVGEVYPLGTKVGTSGSGERLPRGISVTEVSLN